jgi:CRISPR-associated protein Csm3
MANNIRLLGRVIISGKIVAKTGLHIGGSPGVLAIGNVDLPVIRDERTNRPYIPGSSLKGKMRSLSEKWTGAPSNWPIHRGKDDGSGKVEIHVAKTAEDYRKYWVNPIFGVMGDSGEWVTAPNRLLVRDVLLSDDSVKELLNAHTDLPFTEVKWEAAIDRVTSAATPRQIERVPAGAIFSPMELVFSLYLSGDEQLFGNLLTAMRLVQDDYLGGHGSRGSGKVEFKGLNVSIRHGQDYRTDQDTRFENLSLDDLLAKKEDLLKWIKATVAF